MGSFVEFVCSKTDGKYSHTKSYNFATTTILRKMMIAYSSVELGHFCRPNQQRPCSVFFRTWLYPGRHVKTSLNSVLANITRVMSLE